jgi:hexokinase
MIPTHIDAEQDIPIGSEVIVLDAGGTNCRVATVRFQEEGLPDIENYEKFPMPGVHREVSRKEFFSTITDHMEHVVDRSSRIGFCFSYPTEILPNRDGRLLEFSKEIKAPEVVGQLIGENLISSIEAKGHGDRKGVVILNDTVATLLAGRAAFMKREFDTYIGFILGTGTNSCYIESNAAIRKNPDLDGSRHQIINLEAGNFAKMPRGRIDREFDATMINPGQYTYEKMVSGAYFGDLCLRAVREAGRHTDLLSGRFLDSISDIRSLDSIEVSKFLEDPLGGDSVLVRATGDVPESDRVALYYIIDDLVERSAKLTAVNLSSVLIRSKKGEDPLRPVCITAEGSTFYGLKGFKTRVECYMNGYLVEGKGLHYEIVSVESATLIGAAIAGLTN